MKDITIVTAFFDIGRGNCNILARSNEKYFEYFKFWARIQNHLIVYCESKNSEQIRQIRSEFGLAEKTTIKTIDNIYEIESELYLQMKKIEKNINFSQFRYYDVAMSNSADYDYVMLLKYWCIKDAAVELPSDHMVAWLDFGYNHGNERYLKSEEFDFLWKYDFPDKVTAFCLTNPEQVTSIDSLQFQKDCFIGHTLVMPQSMCERYWNYVRTAMLALISLDCIDDDQQLQLMVYKMHSEEFHIIVCGWFEDFELCSNQKFTVRSKKNIQNAPKSFFRQLKDFVRKTMKKSQLELFLKRLEEKGKRYYEYR